MAAKEPYSCSETDFLLSRFPNHDQEPNSVADLRYLDVSPTCVGGNEHNNLKDSSGLPLGSSVCTCGFAPFNE